LAPLLIASVLWGLWTTAEKYSLGGLPVMTVLALSLVASTILLWTVLLVRGHRRPTGSQLRRLALLGLFEPMIGYGAIGLGLTHLAATEGALLKGTESGFVVLLAAMTSRRLPTHRAILGVIAAAVGVAVLGGANLSAGLTFGDLLVLLGSLSAGIATIIAGRAVQDIEPAVVTTYQFSFGLMFTLPLLAVQWSIDGSIAGTATRPSHWLVATVVCGGGLAVAFLLYNYSITKISVSAAGVLLNINPIFGLATAVVFLKEHLTGWQLAGAALILGGIFLFSERAADNRDGRQVGQ
jgi:drug/metabolite transporter (DMT)-like permease